MISIGLKRKRYGYGFVPATKQGWLTIVAYLIVVVGAVAWLPDESEVIDDTYTTKLVAYFGAVILSTVALILVSYKKGPSPKWRWGKKPDDNPDEDF